MAGSLRKRTVASLGLVFLVVLLAASGVLGTRGSILLDDLAQLAGGAAATAACWWNALRRTGPERQWRALLAVGMACWTSGVAVWAFYRSVLDVPLPSTSIADIGFFLFPIFAVPALLGIIGRSPRSGTPGTSRLWLVSLLDGLVIVGSLFVLSWSTVLGAVVQTDQSESIGFLVAIMYPITDLVLVIMVLLLAVVPRILEQYRTQLALLASGLVMLALSDSVYAYLVAIDAHAMPVITDAGFIAGTTLIALAATAPAVSATESSTHNSTRGSWAAHITSDRTQLLLPYALMLVIGVVVGVQWIQDGHTDPVVFILCVTVLMLSVFRQILTLLQNDNLLRRLSAAQEELSYRAHHDGLTGLHNRTSFDETLGATLSRGHAVLLLIDIDDFKSINDRFGHAVGDRLLVAIGERLSRCVGDHGAVGGLVARFGGDEFTALVDGNIDTGCRAATLVVDAIAEPHDIDGHVVSVSASVGVVELRGAADGSEETGDDLLRRADRAMYEAKRHGKAGVFAHDIDGQLRPVYSRADSDEFMDWWGAAYDTPDLPQGRRGTSPNIVAGAPDPARLIGPPTRT